MQGLSADSFAGGVATLKKDRRSKNAVGPLACPVLITYGRSEGNLSLDSDGLSQNRDCCVDEVDAGIPLIVCLQLSAYMSCHVF